MESYKNRIGKGISFHEKLRDLFLVASVLTWGATFVMYLIESSDYIYFALAHSLGLMGLLLSRHKEEFRTPELVEMRKNAIGFSMYTIVGAIICFELTLVLSTRPLERPSMLIPIIIGLTAANLSHFIGIRQWKKGKEQLS